MSLITIKSANILFTTGQVECYCQTTVSHPLGTSVIGEHITLLEASALPADSWTNDDLCVAVQTVLLLAPSDVVVAAQVP